MKIFPAVLSQPFSNTAVACQVSITHIHSSDHQITVDDYLGLLDVLALNSI
jgi:hypothetical protein